MKRSFFIISFLTLVFLWGCQKEPFPSHTGKGKKPVYVPLSELRDIKNLPPQPIEQTGTIFLRDSLFFMMEAGRGIHVFNVKDSLNTIKLTFLSIPAIADFSLFQDRLYAAAWKDLVTLDISDLFKIKEIGRSEGAFSPVLYPPLYNGFFECVDESKGAVVRWEQAFVENVLCSTTN